ncbi:hypothetical protein LZ554_007925 [Drepanopeziza brunnea f. sp. 'monogermtubi']|nr:hypothetical protein LZ554_007925 [Drepanopeziza brunnea f. sp. 'monogermtubi']
MEGAKLAASVNAMSLFRPPIVRSASAALDRTLFSKTIPMAAARVASLKNLSCYRQKLEKSKELMQLERVMNVRPDPDPILAEKGGKCLLLKPEIKAEDPTTWSAVLQEAVEKDDIGIIPYDLKLDYSYWTYHDVMTSLLPEDAQGEIPVGFAIVGHVAHLNLRDEYLPYKKVIAEVLVDKNPQIRTVINKVDDVGTHSVFRTFDYEVLAGPDDMNVELSEGDCIFKFDYSKVYWNITRVQNFVRPYCEDGHTFIHKAADDLLHLTATNQNTVSIRSKAKRPRGAAPLVPPPSPTLITIPPTINHFVMNLPATAIDFVGSFNGLYHSHEKLFTPYTDVKLPMVHVHCFSTKSDDNVKETMEICERISKVLDWEIKPGDEELVVHEVRDVAPKKRMFCATFRIPAEVAFRERRVSS